MILHFNIKTYQTILSTLFFAVFTKCKLNIFFDILKYILYPRCSPHKIKSKIGGRKKKEAE